LLNLSQRPITLTDKDVNMIATS